MKQQLTIPAWLAGPLVAALLGMECWALRTLFELKAEFAGLSAKVEMHIGGDHQHLANK